MTASQESLAQDILAAHAHGRLIPAPSDHGLDTDAAYRVQDAVTQERLRFGARRAGWKLGYTSAVMREQMGIDTPNMGPLLDRMILGDGAVVSAEVVQPKVEPEIAAVMARDVKNVGDVEAAVAEWRLALEIVDSVWQDYRFDWALNTADGSSAAFVVLGDVIEVPDLARASVELIVDGVVVDKGMGHEAMGHPAQALQWLAEQLHVRGEYLRAGDVVITGGLTRAVAFERGSRVRATCGAASVSASRE